MPWPATTTRGTTMYFKQFYLGCLAHASYMIGDAGVAAVVDPQRDIDQYLADAKAQGLTIKYVMQTHHHADFVSGHLELAKRTGAQIVMHNSAGPGFEFNGLDDGEAITLGQVEIKLLHTPGHTPESACYLVTDRADKAKGDAAPYGVLTGDTLFIGEVGRPDLVGSKGYTPQQMAGMMYDSLHGKLMALPDSVLVYPAHGAGSACGKNISSDATFSTIGEQRRGNYALKPMTRDEFIATLTENIPDPPNYFQHNAAMNRAGARELTEVPTPPALSPAQFTTRMTEGLIALDVRPAWAYGAGHIRGSKNIALDGKFAPWVGTLIPFNAPLLLIAEGLDELEQAVMRLARVGYESVVGYLDGGIAEWERTGHEVVRTAQLAVEEVHETFGNYQVVDVRAPSEYENGHLPGAINVPLNKLESTYASIDASRPTAVVCRTGYRSSTAISVLESHGITNTVNVVGGTTAWHAKGYKLETVTADG